MTPTPSDASQAVELPPLPDRVQLNRGIEHSGIAILGFTADHMNDHWLAGYEVGIAQDRAARAQAEPKLPEGWVPCFITYEGDEPEEVAFGPQRMMDRLKKWLTSYFEHIYAERYPAARAQGAGEAVAQVTPSLKRHALESAKALSEYAAAPFFPDTEKRGRVRSTSSDWWDGLADLIEETQPLIARALRECTAPTIPQAAEVPGFVLVPMEPTREMLPEAWRIANGKPGLGVDHECLRAIYRSMLAAAPTPTASAPKAEGEAEHWCNYEHGGVHCPTCDRTREGGDVA